MSASNEGVQSRAVVARLPLGLRILGVVALVGCAILAARFIWEQTVWTWEQGPQMVGFSLAHGSGAILVLSPFLLVLWIAVVIVLTVRSGIRKSRITSTRWAGLGLAVSLLVVMGLPYGFWQRAFISRMAGSKRAGDLLWYAAARGDLATVRALVSHGVSVDATSQFDDKTALHAAAARGDLQTLRYLISKGANINALDRSGDSPLEVAVSAGHDEAANLLASYGAKRIRGDAPKFVP